MGGGAFSAGAGHGEGGGGEGGGGERDAEVTLGTWHFSPISGHFELATPLQGVATLLHGVATPLSSDPLNQGSYVGRGVVVPFPRAPGMAREGGKKEEEAGAMRKSRAMPTRYDTPPAKFSF